MQVVGTWHSRVLAQMKKQFTFVLTAAFVSLSKAPQWFLWTEYKHLYRLSPSADERDGSANCMLLGDWLQHWWGKNSASSPESLFLMNYNALCFVLNMQCVPHGALKVIWQQLGVCNAKVEIKACTHMCTHTLPCSHFLYFCFFFLTHLTFSHSFLWILKCSHVPQTEYRWLR